MNVLGSGLFTRLILAAIITLFSLGWAPGLHAQHAPVEPPSGDQIAEIRSLILDTPVGDMDVGMMQRLYAIHPHAAKVAAALLGSSSAGNLEPKNRRMAELRTEMDRAV